MKFLVAKLNYMASEFDRNYHLNSGGCCYFAYRVAYWLEKYKIDFNFIIQDDVLIEGTSGKHYCIQIVPEGYYINKLDKYSHIKTLTNVSADSILERYENSTWSEKYDQKNNSITNTLVDKVFNYG